MNRANLAHTPQKAKPRLDQLLVKRGLYNTRSRARDAIARGAVQVGGNTITKPGTSVATDCEIQLDDAARNYVSRAALKLLAGLEAFGFDPEGRTALDVGASTGGFTQVLIEQGAAHVIGVDVGHDQIHPELQAHPRVTSIEGLNARELSGAHLENRTIDAVVSDVSFISLKLALPPALTLATPGAVAVLLVKPQFEAGRDAIGKGGLLKDPSLGKTIAEDLSVWLDTQEGWQTTGLIASPIEGGDGNREFLLGGVKT